MILLLRPRMDEPTPAPRPVRSLPLLAISVVDVIFALSELLSRHLEDPPAASGIPPFPAWFRLFLDAHGVALIVGAVGLLLVRRWGFLVTAAAYFGLVLGVAIARQPWVCPAAAQFPLFAVLSLQWKTLR